MAHLDRDGTTIARAAIVADRPDQGWRARPEGDRGQPFGGQSRDFRRGDPAIGARRRLPPSRN